MKIGDVAFDFSLQGGNGERWSLTNHRGSVVVLNFYPADNSPVCTAQLCSVRDHWSDYQELGAVVVGISTDAVDTHKGFAEKHSLPFPLLADTDRKVSEMYGFRSWLPGRSARGVVVIDREGKIAYHKVEPISLFRPKDDDILAAIRAAEKD